jgi:O-antigen/teichoic acid export membrane protein
MMLDVPRESAPGTVSGLPTANGKTAGLLKRIGLNSAWLGLARLVTQAQLAVLTILVARGLDVPAFGQYTLITSIVVVGNVLTTFGTDTLLIREVARDRAGREGWAGAALALQLALSLLIFGLAAAGAGFVSSLGTEAQLGLRLYAAAWIPLAFFSVYTALLRGYQRMDLYLVTNLALVTLQTAGTWVIVRLHPGLVSLLAWLLVTQAAGAGMAAFFTRAAGFAGFARFHWEITPLKKVVRLAWPLGVISLLGIVYQRLGVLTLSSLSGSVQVGWFAAAARIIEAGKLAHIAVLGALLPTLSGLSSLAPPASGARLLRRAMGLLLVLSALAAVLLSAAARPLVTLLFGARYLPTVPLLQVMGWSLLPYTLSACLSVWEITRGRERRLLGIILVSTVFSLAAYGLLIRNLGVQGAAWAALASETLQAAVFLGTILLPRVRDAVQRSPVRGKRRAR